MDTTPLFGGDGRVGGRWRVRARARPASRSSTQRLFRLLGKDGHDASDKTPANFGEHFWRTTVFWATNFLAFNAQSAEQAARGS